jgi:hypothetical protein
LTTATWSIAVKTNDESGDLARREAANKPAYRATYHGQAENVDSLANQSQKIWIRADSSQSDPIDNSTTTLLRSGDYGPFRWDFFVEVKE